MLGGRCATAHCQCNTLSYKPLVSLGAGKSLASGEGDPAALALSSEFDDADAANDSTE